MYVMRNMTEKDVDKIGDVQYHSHGRLRDRRSIGPGRRKPVNRKNPVAESVIGFFLAFVDKVIEIF